MKERERVEVLSLPSGFADWDALLALILRSFASMNGRIQPPSSALRLTPEILAAKAAEETVLLAHAGQRIVGCVFLAPRGDHLYLGKLAVEPEWQRAGIGRKLMQAAEKFAHGAGFAGIELQVRIELGGNHAAFGRMGFVEAARTAHEGFARPTSITMRKALS